MKILVTGGAGYIGSHVVRKLVDKGEEVMAIDTLEFGHKEALPKECEFVKGDIGDERLITKIGDEFKPEAVLHFAGYTKVGESVKEPEKYFDNNIVKSGRMLKILTDKGLRKIIFSSTAAVYGNPVKLPITEDQIKRPTNPYGLSKWWFEQLLDYYDQSFQLRSIRLRYFNACGAALDGKNGEDHSPETHLIPRTMSAALGGPELSLFGIDYPTFDGTCVRDYIHVEDLADVHITALAALEKGHQTDYFNIGTGKGYSNLQIIEMVEKIIGKKVNYVKAPRREGDPAELMADVSKIYKDLGWKAKYSDLETIVKTAWEWHKNHPTGYGN